MTLRETRVDVSEVSSYLLHLRTIRRDCGTAVRNKTTLVLATPPQCHASLGTQALNLLGTTKQVHDERTRRNPS